MNIPHSWLQEILPLPNLNELTDVLAGLGLGVEDVYDLPAPPKGTVVARVESYEAIEGTDNLKLAKISDGERSYNLVTGAPNIKVGMLTTLAKVGTELPVGLQVAKRNIKGMESEGMVCSPKELGLYDYSGGLMEFSKDTPLGRELSDLWLSETVIELEVTPNRADAFSILGVARDLSAKLGVPYKNPVTGLSLGDTSLSNGLSVVLEDPTCKRFTLRLIEDITIQPSPIWLQRRLASIGLRPRNNVVDITNYVTFELGQPSHAYDKNVLTDGKIIVRKAQAKETLTALDEKDYEFTDQDLLITTPNDKGTKPIGIAGVIGGLNHSIKDSTTSVALEIAHFDPIAIRKTAKRYSLSTDASYRFERGVDPNLPPVANARVSNLIAELGSGNLHPALIDVGQGNIIRSKVSYNPSRVHFLMDVEVPNPKQESYLKALGCTVEKQADNWHITPPSWRFDLAITEDLIEEVMRLHGYEHICESIPYLHFIPSRRDSIHRGLRNLLVGFGLAEAMNYTFTSDEELAKCVAPKSTVNLKNPQSNERSVLRTALYPNMLLAAQNNHSVNDLALFEVGNVFNEFESERLCILMRGSWWAEGWLKPQKLDFYLFKGLFEKLAGTLGSSFQLEPRHHPLLHPGISASIYWNDKEIGFLGRLHPEIATNYELGEVYLAELNLPLEGGNVSFSDYSRQPFAERDLAVIVPDDITYAQLASLVQTETGEELISLEPFDVYKGNPIPKGEHSIALRLRFRHQERALSDNEVDNYMAKVITKIIDKGYTIRDSNT